MFLPFLTFEGVEGCGKTTQMRLCAEYLRSQRIDVLSTREPGGTQLGESIRALLLDPRTEGLCAEAELLLFNASRAQHLHEIIRPALTAGRVVLCDRFMDASVAYQGHARGLGLQRARDLCEWVVGDCLPWRTFWFDLEPRTALMRARQRAALALIPDLDRFEVQAFAFHETVREGYLWSANRDPHRIVSVDAEGPPESVFQRLLPHLDELIRHLQSPDRS